MVERLDVFLQRTMPRALFCRVAKLGCCLGNTPLVFAGKLQRAEPARDSLHGQQETWRLLTATTACFIAKGEQVQR